ncbi:MAG: chemotaxis protein CheW, partial [Sphingomonas sp.]|nr:chemotaxis protein CheW [Sphingomonas sp.]
RIDVERLIAKMAATGTRSEAELRALPERAKLDLVFEPGLSSKNVVTSISGRGVGMDVVRANIEQIGGRIELTSTPGRGLCIAIHVPLTLSIISTIVVGVGGQRFALPRQSIEEIVRVRGDAIRIDMLGDTAIATVRDRRMPLVALGEMLGFSGDDGPPPMLALVSVAGGSYALAVEEVLDTEELVIKPAPPAVMASGLYAGQTLPDSGRPMLLLDAAGIAAAAGLRFERAVVSSDEENGEESAADLRALLFFDLDGTRRAVPLDIVERVELASAAAVRLSAGQLRLSIDDALIPLATIFGDNGNAAIDSRGEIGVLRMADGRSEIGYAIAEALDIVALSEAMIPARTAGPIAGVFLIDGEQVEMLDIHWLFAHHAEPKAASTMPVCLLAGEQVGWMNSFLRPVLEGAGYRVITQVNGKDRPSVTLAMESDAAVAHGNAPVVRLRAEADATDGVESVYRYDRDAVLAALAVRQNGSRTA